MKNKALALGLIISLALSSVLDANITGTKRLHHLGNSTKMYLERYSTSEWAVVRNYMLNSTKGGNTWEITAVGSGLYKIECGNRALTKAGDADWAVVKSATYNGWSGQKWQIIDIGGGNYKIISNSNGKALTGNGSTSGNVTTVTYNGWGSQKWKLKHVDTSDWPSGNFTWIFDGVDRNWNITPTHDDTLIINCHIHDVDHRAINVVGFDNIYIQNTTITNANTDFGINIENSSNVTVDDCLLDNQIRPSGSHSAFIRVKGSSSITLRNNRIFDADGNGIFNESTANLVIEGNRIENVGLFPYSPSAPFHGIYSKSRDALLTNNTIRDCMDGSGISMRTSGVISYNVITDCLYGGISYWPMVSPGASNRLDIINNTIVQNNYDINHTWSAAACIGIYDSGNKPPSNYFDTFLIKDNNCHIKAASGSNDAMVSMSAISGYGYGNVDVINNILTDDRSIENHLDNETQMDSITGNTYN